MKRVLPGFTLIELLVVIAIIGIMTAMAAPTFRQAQQVSRLTLSQDLLQTELDAAFSRARSSRLAAGVRGTAEASSILRYECPCSDGGCPTSYVPDICTSVGETTLGLNVEIENDFDVVFVRPHGDILYDPLANTLTPEGLLQISIGFGDNGRRLHIHPVSGLIEPVAYVSDTPVSTQPQ